MEADLVPNDPKRSNQWGLGYMGAYCAWDLMTVSPSTVDCAYGIDASNHDSDPSDDSFHGTHVAGVLGAVGNTGIGVVGLIWQTRLTALKCLGLCHVIGANAAAIECVTCAISQKLEESMNVVAVNTSWGGNSYPYDPFLEDAVPAVGGANIVWCCLTGNESRDTDLVPRFPSCYESPNILAVAASDYRPAERITGWSNWGATPVDLAASGQDMYSI